MSKLENPDCISEEPGDDDDEVICVSSGSSELSEDERSKGAWRNGPTTGRPRKRVRSQESAPRGRRRNVQARKSTGVPPKWRSEQVDKSDSALSDESDTESSSRVPSEPGRRYPKGGKKWSAIVAHNSNSESGSQNSKPSPSCENPGGDRNGKGNSAHAEPEPEPSSSAQATPDVSTDEESLCDGLSARESILKLDGWNLLDATDSSRETFCKEYSFKGFNEAWNFMSQVTVKLQVMNHHPDWHQVNNKVKVSLPSSDADGLTSKDSILAEFMDKVAKGINV
ncbi:unnamed protein product [Allacma fusca]|uniref:4-alpha-hydroxy-tetrahydropterin dehydratase n=1 Tax=Allacma fusca TaxID=39272 RepID=A0A8J2LQG7_9HEXA|nr:unnamed protein product [Allacma fusca]